MNTSVKQLLYFLCLLAGLADAQAQVTPGDANNNGLIDHHDMLSVGYAMGANGPMRIQSGTTPNVVIITQFWPQYFPNGLNYAFADANGNGWVELTDFLPIVQNYGWEHENFVELYYPAIETEDVPHPEISWVGDLSGEQLIAEGESASFDLDLSGLIENLPSDSLNGLSFSIFFDPQPIDDIELDITQTWLNADSMGFVFKRRPTANRIDVALTRLGADPLLNEGGSCGTLNLTIVDDLIWLLEGPADTLETCLVIDNILAVDGNFQPVPIEGSEICLRLHLADVVASDPYPAPEAGWVKLAPNPSSGLLQLATERSFERVELLDMLGVQWLLYEGPRADRWTFSLPETLPPGQYWLRLSGPEATALHPLMLAR